MRTLSYVAGLLLICGCGSGGAGEMLDDTTAKMVAGEPIARHGTAEMAAPTQIATR